MSLMQHEAIVAAMGAEPMEERLFVTPLLDAGAQIGQASIDLRLGSEFIEARRRAEDAIDPLKREMFLHDESEDRYEIPFGDHLVLHPGQFLLGCTFEFIRLPAGIGGQVLARSSWGRFGLIVATAVAVQPGFAGSLTLELQNLGSIPIRLYPGLRVAQLMLWRTLDPVGADHLGPPAAPPLGPVSRKLGWDDSELERLAAVKAGLSGATPP